MYRKASINSFLVLTILLFFLSLIFIAFGSKILITPNQFPIEELDGGWSLWYRDNYYNDVDISGFDFNKIKKGEIIAISRTMPGTKTIAPTVMFENRLSTITVLIDGEEVTSYGQSYLEEGNFVPKKYHFITIDRGYEDHELKIVFEATENNYLGNFSSIKFGSKSDLVRNFFQMHRLSIFVGGFFGMYSCLLLAIATYLFLNHKKDMSLFYSSAISFLFAIYTYAYSDIFFYISDHEYFFAVLEYVSLYLMPLSLSMLLYSTHPEIATGRQKILLKINGSFPIIFSLLHFSGMVHFNHSVIPTQVISVVEAIIILPPLIIGMQKQHTEKKKSATYTGVDADIYLLLGFVVMIVFALLEIGKYNLDTFFKGQLKSISSINFLSIGALYFVIFLFIYYFMNRIDHTNSIYVKKHLEGLAYTDALTGLKNRAKCMQFMTLISGSYAIISLDLDRLKYVNDTYGHLEGDKMLKTFAQMLVKSFESASLIGRIGGDEFIVVIENPTADICDKCIRKLEKNMEDFNLAGKENFRISTSVGYAYSNELHNKDYKELFFLADTRMYEMKERHHHE